MSNIIVRESKQRIDPKHPESTDATWQHAYDVGQKRIAEGKLKFPDRGAEEHYWKMVKANPANVPGLPDFAPPLVIRSSGFFSLKRDCQKQGHRWSNTMDAWCLDCEVDKPQTEPQAQEV